MRTQGSVRFELKIDPSPLCPNAYLEDYNHFYKIAHLLHKICFNLFLRMRICKFLIVYMTSKSDTLFFALNVDFGTSVHFIIKLGLNAYLLCRLQIINSQYFSGNAHKKNYNFTKHGYGSSFCLTPPPPCTRKVRT